MSAQKRKHLRKGKDAAALPLVGGNENNTDTMQTAAAEDASSAGAVSLPEEGISPAPAAEEAPKARHPLHTRPMFWIILILIAGILAAGCYVWKQYSGLADQISAVLDVDTVYSGVRVCGVDVSGMTREEVQSTLEDLFEEEMEKVRVTLSLDGENVATFDADDVTIEHDLEETLEKVMQVGRTGSRYRRYEYVCNLPNEPVDISFSYTVDPAPAEKWVRNIGEYMTRQPSDAYIVSFNSVVDDYNDPLAIVPEGFTVQEAIHGCIIEVDALWENVRDAFAGKEFGNVEMTYYLIEPEVTSDEFMGDLQLLGSITTVMTDDPNRIHNIKMACAAVTGTVVQPGETFSYNECLGPRTLAAGYKEAGVITNGRSDTGLGGGICQVASMVYNAAVLGDMRIDERSRHSYVLDYIAAGTDATVDYGKLDMKFTNTKETPVYIRAWVNGLTITVEIYGTPRADGLRAQFRTDVLNTYHPGDTVYVADASVRPGRPEYSSAHNGCWVKVYRIYVDDTGAANEALTEFLHEDQYPAIPRQFRVHPDDYEEYAGHPLENTD